MSYSDYDSIDAISGSKLIHIRRSPAHFRANLETGDKDSAALIFGRAFHTCVLEGHSEFEKTCKVCPEVKSRNNKKYDEMLDDYPGCNILLEPEEEKILKMADAIIVNRTAQELLKDTKKEVVIVWKCRSTGVLCKGRLDAWNKELNSHICLKTCGDASFFKFRNDATMYDYDLKAAWYTWGMYELGENIESNLLIAIEKEEPFGIMNWLLDSEHLKMCAHENASLLKKYACCVTTGKWPCYEDMVSDLSMQEWKVKDLQNRFAQNLEEEIK